MSISKPHSTSWMWSAGEGVNGAQIDEDRRMIAWFDEVGCACGSSNTLQTFEDFKARGAKFDTMPPDIVAQVHEVIAWYEAQD